MTQRAKLEIPINQPVEIELLYDEPITGKSQFGVYFMYAVKDTDGTEFTYFAPDEVHAELKQLNKGDRARLTKLATQRGSKFITTYEVRHLNTRNRERSDNVAEINERVVEDDEQPERLNADINDDDLYNIMLKSCREAQRISAELGGFAEPVRLAITLFIARTKG